MTYKTCRCICYSVLTITALLTTPNLHAAPSIAPAPYTIAPPPIQPRTGESLIGLSRTEKQNFISGRKKFIKSFSAAEGLGPVFNDVSCSNCHGRPEPTSPIPLGGSSIGHTMSTTRFGSSNAGTFDPLLALGGSLLQSRSTSTLAICRESVPPQANTTSFRLTTPTFGSGLIEAIPDASIIAGSSNPNVSGTAHMVTALEDPNGPQRVGRFGWKAQVPTVLSFAADASLNELGITNRLMLAENAPQGNQAALATCDGVADPEALPDSQGLDFIDHVTNFQRFLAAPPQTPKSGMRGEAIFHQIGCADCHTPSFRTSNSAAFPTAIRGKIIKPYSDFLLHDMGAAADGIAQGNAGPREMRTPPLWGLINRSFFWHDGSQYLTNVASLDRIVLGEITPWITFHGHNAPGSESVFAAQAYAQLSGNQQTDLLNFLKSLGQAEFDFSGNNRVDQNDIGAVRSCRSSGASVFPDDLCARADIMQDGLVDNNDLNGFVEAYQDPQIDCDCNGQNDLMATLTGAAPDTNADGYPDTCNVRLSLSVGPTFPLFDWEPLHRGLPAQIAVSGAAPGDSLYLFASFVTQTGSTSGGLLPAPYTNLCLNLPLMRNFNTVVGSAPIVTANSNGSAFYTVNIPSSGVFANITQIRFQAVSIGASGYRRSSVLSKELE